MKKVVTVRHGCMAFVTGYPSPSCQCDVSWLNGNECAPRGLPGAGVPEHVGEGQ